MCLPLLASDASDEGLPYADAPRRATHSASGTEPLRTPARGGTADGKVIR